MQRRIPPSKRIRLLAEGEAAIEILVGDESAPRTVLVFVSACEQMLRPFQVSWGSIQAVVHLRGLFKCPTWSNPQYNPDWLPKE